MSRTILLIRHGESEINVQQPPVIGGRSSWCELTPRGIAQARALGRWLAARGETCDRVVSSTAVRAQQTARYCLEEAGIPLRRIQLFPELEELSQGEWENQLRSVILTPETVGEIEALHWEFRAPGGESMADVHRRAMGWLEREILEGHAVPGRRVWVFCHGVLIKALLAGLFDLERRTAWQISIDNTSITELVLAQDGWRLLGQNETPHLSAS